MPKCKQNQKEKKQKQQAKSIIIKNKKWNLSMVNDSGGWNPVLKQKEI